MTLPFIACCEGKLLPETLYVYAWSSCFYAVFEITWNDIDRWAGSFNGVDSPFGCAIHLEVEFAPGPSTSNPLCATRCNCPLLDADCFVLWIYGTNGTPFPAEPTPGCENLQAVSCLGSGPPSGVAGVLYTNCYCDDPPICFHAYGSVPTNIFWTANPCGAFPNVWIEIFECLEQVPGAGGGSGGVLPCDEEPMPMAVAAPRALPAPAGEKKPCCKDGKRAVGERRNVRN